MTIQDIVSRNFKKGSVIRILFINFFHKPAQSCCMKYVLERVLKATIAISHSLYVNWNYAKSKNQQFLQPFLQTTEIKRIFTQMFIDKYLNITYHPHKLVLNSVILILTLFQCSTYYRGLDKNLICESVLNEKVLYNCNVD